MNKAELVNAISEKAALSKKDAEKVLAAFTETVTESLTAGEKVQIVGFGSFEVVNRAARTARNPRTGEAVEIAASKAPAFKAGKALNFTFVLSFCSAFSATTENSSTVSVAFLP